jgi:hypothetical protein
MLLTRAQTITEVATLADLASRASLQGFIDDDLYAATRFHKAVDQDLQ